MQKIIILSLLIVLISTNNSFLSKTIDKISSVFSKNDDNYECNIVKGNKGNVWGPEDIDRLTEDIFIMASVDRVRPSNPGEDYKVPQGKISVYYVAEQQLVTLEVEGLDQIDFQPLGIYYDETSNTLYSINLTYEGGSKIEEFSVDMSDIYDIQVSHVRSLYLDLSLTGLFNGIIKVAPGKIIGTSFQLQMPSNGDKSQETKMGALSALAYATKSNIGHLYLCEFDENNTQDKQYMQCTQINNSQSPFNNGINWNRKETVIVDNTVNKTVTVYKLNLEADPINILEKLYEVPVDGLADNIDYDRFNDRFEVAGLQSIIPQLELEVLSYEKERAYLQFTNNKKVPTFVNVLQFNGSQYAVTKTFLWKNAITGTSSGLLWKNNTLICGTWVDKSIARCTF